MIRLGLLDFDSSHCVEFTKRLNQRMIGEDQWVHGARVVVACPGESLAAPERVAGFTDEMKQMDVPLVNKSTEMIGKVDGMLILSLDGSVHWERTRPFLDAGLPCFVDKPFACSVADARKIFDVADKKRVAVFSASALRYATELVEFLRSPAHATLTGAITYGPALHNPRNPGLFHYGIHALEVLYTLMGPGCLRVSCVQETTATVATGIWRDGRIGTIRASHVWPGPYGAIVHGEHECRSFSIDTQTVYCELLKKVVAMFQTGKPPLDPEETLELIGFIEAANQSALLNGVAEALVI
jgi:virulence factor